MGSNDYPSVELEMLFIDDLIDEMYDAMEGKPHRAEYPKTGEVIDGVEYDGLTPQPKADGRYCYAPVTHKATLGRIVELLHTFHNQPQNLIMPTMDKELYMFSYVGISHVDLFGAEFEFRFMRTFNCAHMIDFEKVKRKAEVLDDGDDIKITFRAGDDKGTIDTLKIPDNIERAS